jgi:uncharacterized membrane-anchored protein YitT (DUF2179 family)/predicted metal-dependent HD superfamily phosphohydrolase
MNYEQAYTFMMRKLETGLPSYLTYHNAAHTRRVIANAEHLAAAENVTGDELTLLRTAALFHDTGYLQNHEEHEELSCRIAARHLPEFGYSKEQIDKICLMIRCTKIPQSPADHTSRILCDADLYYLGEKDYAEVANGLYDEMRRLGQLKSQHEWQLKQAEFLSTHQYYTTTAINERQPGKMENLDNIRKQIESMAVRQEVSKPWAMIQDSLLMLAGVLLAGIALKGFLVPNHFFDGGVTGISLLTHEIYHINLALVIILFNLPLIVVSYFSVGRRFALRMLSAVLLLGLCLQLLPAIALTADKLLISIFGGAFLGIGIGLVMRAGAALDGIEVLALYTLKKTSFTISEIILGINIFIFSIAAFKFGLETALYSILTYFTATRCIDYVVEGIQAYTGVTIISGKSEVIKYQLVNKLGRGITVYKGERGFLPGKFEVSSEVDIIFTVITRLELRRLKNLVYEADPKAFVFANTIKEASGGILKRRHSH